MVETLAGVPVRAVDPKTGMPIPQAPGGFADGAAREARFNAPTGLAVGLSGNLFVADTGNNRIRQVSLDGSVSTFAGDGSMENLDGTGVYAGVPEPVGLAFDAAGNLYVTQLTISAIRRISPEGEVFTIHREKNADALSQIAIDADGPFS